MLMALLLVFAPGIAFALFELFFFPVPVRGKARVVGWASLAVGGLCVVGLVGIMARDALRRRKERVPGP